MTGRIYTRKPAEELRSEKLSIPVTIPFLTRLDAAATAVSQTRTEFCRVTLERMVEGLEATKKPIARKA